MHGTTKSQRHSDAVENIAVGKDPDVEVGLYDVMELALLLISEEAVWHPDLGAVRHGEVLDPAAHVVKLQPVVIPLLSEGDLNTELHLDIVNLFKTPNKH